MGVRIACFVLMVLIQPYGWYTWVFAAGAIFLPYIAVVVANVGSGPAQEVAISPERAIEAPAPRPATVPVTDAPTVFRIQETRTIDPPGRSSAA
jgi:hypothetical protein